MEFAAKFNSDFRIDRVSVSHGSGISTGNVEQGYEEVDYSDEKTTLSDVANAWDDVFLSPTEGIELSLQQTESLIMWLFDGKIGEKNTMDFIQSKLLTSSIYAYTKGDIAEQLTTYFKDILVTRGPSGTLLGSTSWSSTIFNDLGISDGIVKTVFYVGSCLLVGDEIKLNKVDSSFTTGSSKAFAKNTFKAGVSALEKSYLKSIKVQGFEKVGDLLKKVSPEKLLEDFPIGTITSLHGSQILSAVGVDYAASLVANAIGAWTEDGKVSLAVLADGEKMRYGSSLLKSTTKEICGYAGSLIGPTGKLVGTAVGAFVGELQVGLFTDEEGKTNETWCAIAAGAEITGAIVGVAVALCSSNPIGWCILAGAAIGYGVVAVTYLVVENWDNIVTGVSNFIGDVGEALATTGAFIGDAAETVVTWVEDTAEKVGDWVDEKVEQAGAWIEEKVEVIEDFVNDSIDWIESAANTVSSWFSGWW